METFSESKLRFGSTVWGAVMDRSGMNQTEIYKQTGVSVKTQKNWSAGLSCPQFLEGNRFAANLKVNLLRPYMSYLHPELIDLAATSTDNEIRQAVIWYFESATEQEVMQTRYMLARPNWIHIRESFHADAHLPLWGRVLSTYQVLTMMDTAKQYGEYDFSGELPDERAARYAMGKGKDAFASGSFGYAMDPAHVESENWSAAFSAALTKAKNYAGVSNEYLAYTLGRTPGTISLWLSGVNEPNLFLAAEFFKACHRDPVRIMMGLLYPAPCNVDSPDMSEDRAFLIDHFRRCDIRDAREFCYWIYALHGGSWHSMLQKYSIGARLPDRYQRFICGTVLSMFEMCRDAGILVGTDHIMPDYDILRDGALGGMTR